MPTYFIHIAGRVQGVGFRPFVYRLATQLGLAGRASNQPDGVHMTVCGTEEKVAHFYRLLRTEAPPLAQIQHQHIQQVKEQFFDDFRIVQDVCSTAPQLILTPDLALCEACRHELTDKKNRRYGYAFTTCTNCGPRFSIIASLPFERENTTMAPFAMCPDCQREYLTPTDRRYFAQTNSCPNCPILLLLYTSEGQQIKASQHEMVKVVVSALQSGRIVAVKGLAGYLLLADATNPETIRELRKRKHRPTKPFALMYPSLRMARQDVQLHDEEKELLRSAASPIVLATQKATLSSGVLGELIAPHLKQLGIMLPYTPLFALLLDAFQKPLIATSANTSGNPIIFKDADALTKLQGMADLTLTHSREILVGQDDSVVRFTPRHRQQLILRRARGYAPTYFASQKLPDTVNILAMGADLKSTFAISMPGQTCLSHYLGDLGAYDNQLHFERNLEHFARLYDFAPRLILTDKHPGYTSTRIGQKMAEARAIPCVQVQHHEAHFAAVLAENNLLHSTEPVLGVIWDGNGYGPDGKVRGGEFLRFQDGEISQLAHLSPFPHLAGDKMANEPRLSALALCHDLPDALNILKPYFSSTEWKVYQSILAAGKYKQETTSMGRLFDGVAALLGLCATQTYEGEAAMRLEALASKEPDVYQLTGYTFEAGGHQHIAVISMITQLLSDIKQGIPASRIAARFHVALVRLIQSIAQANGFQKIAFSGGVFQNSLLVDLLIEKLQPKYELYFHRQLPPNDACIAYGQLAWLQLQHQPKKDKLSANNQHKAQQLCV